jgi:S-formylglutathione hydrolase FrmB
VRPFTAELAGRLDEAVMDSPALRGNPLGDPSERPLWVYCPPGYEHSEQRYPAIYVIQGYGGSIAMWRNRTPFRPTMLERIDDLFSGPDAPPPALVVFVDAWTSYGGSQYVDSPGTGRYHTYLCEDVVGYVDAHWRTLPGRDHRAITGKSSGGFGAMITPMLRPDVFGALASHAGDSLYELCYGSSIGKVVRALRDEYGGSYENFWQDFKARVPFAKESDADLVMYYGVAACFSADEDGSVKLPFELETGRLIPEVWQRWLDWDPVRMAPRCAEALRSLRAIWVDAGRRDQFFLDLGAQAFVNELTKLGVTDVHFELFEGTHTAIEYRYPEAICYLAERLAEVA